jgi:hypothetical protein
MHPRPRTNAAIKKYLESLTGREVWLMSQDAYQDVPRDALTAAEALVYGAAAWFLGYQTPDAELIGDLQMDDENGGGDYLPVGGYDVIREWAGLRKPARHAARPAPRKPAAKKPAAKKRLVPPFSPSRMAAAPPKDVAMNLYHSGQAKSLQEAWDMVRGIVRVR